MTTPLTRIPARHADLTGKLPAPALPDEAVQTTGDQAIAGRKDFAAPVTTPQIDHGTQTGTIAAPNAQMLMKFQSRDPALARWELSAIGSFFVGIYDPILQFGYNTNQNDADPGRNDESMLYLGFEANYFEPPTSKYTAESYIQYNPPRTAPVQFQRRPWMFTLDKVTGSTRFAVELGPAQPSFGYFQITGGAATGGSFQLMSVVTGDADASSGMTRLFTPLEVSQNTTFNKSVEVKGGFSCAPSASDDTYLGTDQYDRCFRLNVGTTMRSGSRHMLLGRNLQGSNSFDYITSGTGSYGYAGIEFRDSGDIRIYATTGATTAGGAVTPASRLTITAATGAVTTSGLFSASGGLSVGGGATITKVVRASATLAFPSVAAGGQQELTISATGATTGAAIHLGPPAGLESGLIATARVSATDTVTVRLVNVTGSPISPASATYRVDVFNP